MLLSITSVILIVVASLLKTNPFGHRYFIASYICLTILALVLIQNNFKNKTLLIVSHRVSCVKHADNIIVLENGKIIQNGTHKELIKNEGFYKELYTKQNSEINKEI